MSNKMEKKLDAKRCSGRCARRRGVGGGPRGATRTAIECCSEPSLSAASRERPRNAPPRLFLIAIARARTLQ